MINPVHHVPNRGYFPSGKALFDHNLLKIILKIAAVVGVIYVVIKGYLRFNTGKPIEPIEGNIEEIKKVLLEKAPHEVGSRDFSSSKNVKRYGTKLGIFSLNRVPNLIFKKDMFNKTKSGWRQSRLWKMCVKTRYQNIQTAKQIIDDMGFKHLRVPQSVMFETIKRSQKFQILAQEKFTPLLDRTGKPLKPKDANLTDEAVRELVLFILKTGYFDVDNRNLFIVEEKGERKIAIIDFEYADVKRLHTAFHGGSINGGKTETISGLFKTLPRKSEVINAVLKENGRQDLMPSL